MKKAFVLAVALGVAVVFAGPSIASAQLHPGTKLVGDMDRTLNSKDVQVGQTFQLHSVHTTNHDINGATLYGHVAHVQRAGQGTPAKIELDVDKLNTTSGNIYKISGEVLDVQVNTKSNAGKEAMAAGGGALVGGLLGGGTWALIGAAGGYVVAKNSRQNVTIPQGSLVTVQVSQVTKVK
ncbi:MAG: hypothetical protein JOZ91_00130 [Candidatus Eremiobacteraeota bacterium]|nr:hypothetical protein [Candidatus Eremiobacteraeota bacterium]MBV8338901.1 hypothetical protein [Candidatus Eremiobacteraeota bacterium]MBV8461311.1 hypothetical protein [Candidatus Eremiobacteraeota bacterium]MBV8669659.1 hypothetical protein [Candidatus Eremiobacteraeota bacterium]MBV8671781.1 hypothetical protein [Candidatus Eremiobacteraeota bacterium]